MVRVRLPALAVGPLLASALVVQGAPAGAQGVPTATPTPVPGATGNSGGTVTFRCPGVTEVSAGAESPSGLATPSAVPVLSPGEQAESPCVIPGSEPELEWSADYSAQRMTAPGTWKTKMRSVLADFDALHRQYAANPRVKDMGMWPARLEETLQLLELLANQSRQDVVVYYARALGDEYKAGIFEEHPLLTQYGLQARAMLAELTAPPPTPTPHPRDRR